MLGDGERAGVRARRLRRLRRRASAQQFVERYGELAGRRRARLPVPGRATASSATGGTSARDKRRDDDHLSLVANLQPRAGPASSRSRGRRTRSPRSPALAGRRGDPAARAATRCGTLRAQADLQLRSRGLDRPLYELLEPEHDRGLGRLPAPSPATCFFDFEGDPNWGDEGLEYLFGTVYEDGRRSGATGRCGRRSRAEEKHALEQWIDWITARLEEHPDLHVFHYNAYEPVALKRAGRPPRDARARARRAAARARCSSTCTASARQAMRAGVESYGLKAMEAVSSASSATPSCATRSARCGAGRPATTTATSEQLDEHRRLQRGRLPQHAARCYAGCSTRRPEAEAQYGIDARRSSRPSRPSRRPTKLAAYLARLEAMRPRLLDRPARRRVPGHRRAARRRARRSTCSATTAARPSPRWWAFFARRSKTPRRSCATRTPRRSADLDGDRASTVDDKSHGSGRMRVPRSRTQARPGRRRRPARRARRAICRARRGRPRTRRGDPRTHEGRRSAASRSRPAGPTPPTPRSTPLFRFAERVADWPGAVRPSRRRHRPPPAPRAAACARDTAARRRARRPRSLEGAGPRPRHSAS